jgi:hypothetical protein
MNHLDKIFYHFDRSGKLRPGDTLNLETPHFQSKHVESLRSMVQKLYPFKLSLHGPQHLLENDLLIERWIVPTATDPHSGAVIHLGPVDLQVFPDYSTTNDLVLELVRRCEFPAKPSRFESFFAWENEETARQFTQDFKVKCGKMLKCLRFVGFQSFELICRGRNSDIQPLKPGITPNNIG